MKSLLSLLFLLALVSGVVGWCAYQTINRVHLVPEENVVFVIDRGESFGQVAQRLKDSGIIDETFYFNLLARHEGFRTCLKAGEYLLPKAYTYEALLQVFCSGRSVQYSVTFPEGIRFREVRSILLQSPKLRQLLGTIPPDVLPERLGISIQVPSHLEGLPAESKVEGWVFPDTYFYTRDMSDVDILRQAVKKMQMHLAEVWLSRNKDIPLKSPYELLILASIVEKETSVPEERPLIAGVFVNRLKAGMRLQTDPTVIYGLGESFDGNLTRAHLRGYTPYNTYRIKGLPPTPIAMPGLASLMAVARPAETDALYFVADKSGGHKFSATLKEHNRAVRKYQKSK